MLTAMVRLCFVCLGNICRSPTAEGVMRHLLEERGLAREVGVDSAGTGAYHVGEPPDRRATKAAKQRGIELTGRARKFNVEDFERFDYVLAMDRSNFDDLMAVAPKHLVGRLSLLRDFEPASPRGSSVPDPYYGGVDGFEEVIDLCLAACQALLDHLVERHGLSDGR